MQLALKCFVKRIGSKRFSKPDFGGSLRLSRNFRHGDPLLLLLLLLMMMMMMMRLPSMAAVSLGAHYSTRT